jgi:hypothetical protein
MELPEKIEAAIVKFLQGFSTTDVPPLSWPVTMNANKVVRIFPGESDAVKDGQCVLVIAGDSPEETPAFTGNNYIPVQVVVRTPLKQLTPDEIKNQTPSPKSNHSLAASILDAAIGQDAFALVAALNANGTDLTIMGGVMDRRQTREQQTEFWQSGWEFRLYCANRSF